MANLPRIPAGAYLFRTAGEPVALRSPIAALLLLFLLSAFPCGAADLPAELHKALYAAQQSLAAGEAERACRTLTDYLEQHPKSPHPALYEELGRAWYARGNLEKAADAFRSGIRLDPESLSLQLNLGKVAYDAKAYTEAGDSFAAAYEISRPRNSDLLYQAAAAYYAGNEPNAAGSVLQRLLAVESEPAVDALTLMIRVRLDQGREQEAEPLIRRLLERQPDAAPYWKLLARIRMERKDDAGAAAALAVARGITPLSAFELETLAGLYQRLELPLKALRTLAAAFGPDPHPDQLERLARLAVRAHLPEQALDLWQAAIAKAPTGDRYLERGTLLFEMGRWNAAAADCAAALRLDGGAARAHLLMGLCALETGDIDAARHALRQASASPAFAPLAENALAYLERFTEG